MVGQGLSRALADDGMAIDWVRNGMEGRAAIANGDYQLVLLDLGLPGMSGLELLRMLRDAGDDTPLIVITARDGIDDRVVGLDLGADDFLVKPFEYKELSARIRAIRRRHAGHAVSTIGNGEIVLNLATHEASFRGTSLLLPAREFALLHALVERPGAVLSRAQLEERLYGWNETVGSNAVDVLIHYLRKKFGNDIIRNVRGVGWMVARGSS